MSYNKSSSKLNVPEAKAAMDKFKMEAASEVGVFCFDFALSQLDSFSAL